MSLNCRSKKEWRNWGRKRVPDPGGRENLCQAICRAIAATPEYDQADRVGVFVAQAWEVDLRFLWARDLEKCAFPRVNGDTLDFFHVDSAEQLIPDYAGIPAPPPDLAKAISRWGPNDLILVPGVVFDRLGTRLGSGKGFYDRYFSSKGENVQRWGVCWERQTTEELLPKEEHDVSVDAICNESGVERLG